jgi:two-component system, NtrC family, nitrogen regulation response regulator NtrX
MREGKHVILCVDDDPDFRESLRIILESNDYLVEEAASAEEALRHMNAVKPDLILLDLMMEEIDSGSNFVKELRLRGQKPPIFMLSSVGDAFSGITSYSDLGLDGMLQKPVQPAKLLNMLKEKLKKLA